MKKIIAMLVCLSFLTWVAVPIYAADGAAAANVTCKDGSTSTASGKGACSHHGGVAAPGGGTTTSASSSSISANSTAATPESKKSTSTASSSTTAPSDGKTPTAKCKDGSLSYSTHHSGTCSHHGGVAEWLQPKQ